MRDKMFTRTALKEMNKVYRIREQIIPKEFVHHCQRATMDSVYRSLTKEELEFKALDFARMDFFRIKQRCSTWAAGNLDSHETDERVVWELKRFIEAINDCLQSRFANHEVDPILEDAKEGLEALIVMAELAI